MSKFTPSGVKRIYLMPVLSDKNSLAVYRNAEKELSDAGYWVVNPLDIDPQVAGFSASSDSEKLNNQMKANLIAALHCDGIATVGLFDPLLNRLELDVARSLSIPIWPAIAWIMDAKNKKENK